MTGARIRVLLVDAHPLQRQGWRQMLDAQHDATVVAEAADGLQALAVLRTMQVDVAVIDVRLSRLGGLQVVEQLAADARVRLTQRPDLTRVVLVTATDLDRYLPLGVAAGAQTVVWKDAPPDDLLATIRAAAAARTLPVD